MNIENEQGETQWKREPMTRDQKWTLIMDIILIIFMTISASAHVLTYGIQGVVGIIIGLLIMFIMFAVSLRYVSRKVGQMMSYIINADACDDDCPDCASGYDEDDDRDEYDTVMMRKVDPSTN